MNTITDVLTGGPLRREIFKPKKEGFSKDYEKKVLRYRKLYQKAKRLGKDITGLPNPEKYVRVKATGLGTVPLPGFGPVPPVLPLGGAGLGLDVSGAQQREEKELEQKTGDVESVLESRAIKPQVIRGRSNLVRDLIGNLLTQGRGIIPIRDVKLLQKFWGARKSGDTKARTGFQQKILNLFNRAGIKFSTNRHMNAADLNRESLNTILQNRDIAMIISAEIMDLFRDEALRRGEWTQNQIDENFPKSQATIEGNTEEPVEVERGFRNNDEYKSLLEETMEIFGGDELQAEAWLEGLEEDFNNLVLRSIEETGEIRSSIDEILPDFIHAVRLTLKTLGQQINKDIISRPPNDRPNYDMLILSARNIMRTLLSNTNIPKPFREALIGIAVDRLRVATGSNARRTVGQRVGEAFLQTAGAEEVDSDDEAQDLGEQADVSDLQDVDLQEGGGPPDDDYSFTLTINGRRRRFNKKRFILFLVGLGFTAKKAIDVIRDMIKDKEKKTEKKKEKDTDIELPIGPPEQPVGPVVPDNTELNKQLTDNPSDVINPLNIPLGEHFGEPYEVIDTVLTGDRSYNDVVADFNRRQQELINGMNEHQKNRGIRELIRKELAVRDKQLATFRKEWRERPPPPSTEAPETITPSEPPETSITNEQATLLPMTREWTDKYKLYGVMDEAASYNALVRGHNANVMSGSPDLTMREANLKRLRDLYAKIQNNFQSPQQPAGSRSKVEDFKLDTPIISKKQAQLLPTDQAHMRIYEKAGVKNDVMFYNEQATNLNNGLVSMKANDKSLLDYFTDIQNKIIQTSYTLEEVAPITGDPVRKTPTQSKFELDAAEDSIVRWQKNYADAVSQFTAAKTPKDKQQAKINLDRVEAGLREAHQNLLNKDFEKTPTTNLDNSVTEVFPISQNESERFQRIQQLENHMKNSKKPDMWDWYYELMKRKENQLESFGGNRDKYYSNRDNIINEIYKNFGVTQPEQPEDIRTGKAIDLVDTTIQDDPLSFTKFVLEDTGRADKKIGGSAFELGSTPEEKSEENIRWKNFSLITPDRKLGNMRQNPLVRKNNEEYISRFKPWPDVPMSKRVPAPNPHPIRPEQIFPRTNLYPPTKHRFFDAYDNTAFPVLETPDRDISVDRAQVYNRRNIHYPELSQRTFVGEGNWLHDNIRRMDGQRFTGDDILSSGRYTYSAPDLFGDGGVPSDMYPFPNARGFGKPRLLSNLDYKMARKN